MKRVERTAPFWMTISTLLAAGCASTATSGVAQTDSRPASPAAAATKGWATKGLVVGQESAGPWWMQQTALTREGRLDLKAKPWWDRAATLKLGEQFFIDASGELKDRMLVRREQVKDRGGRPFEAIVWVIDDDADGSLAAGGDRDSDCYVADYGGDGKVDRMLDYIDDDGDNDPDEMDIRYFVDGELRYTWFGMDVDDDGLMWSLSGYEYGGTSFFEADPYGDSMIYMNKLNTEEGTWLPISECPFAFYDADRDGFSEVVVRISAVPLRYDTNVDPDYANDYNRFRAKWSPEMRNMGIVNIRYSFDVDNLSGPQTPLHYEMGYNLVGATPYKVPGVEHYNPRRRPPQVTIVTPWKDLPSISDRFEARETGFTWHENFDDTVAIGYAEHEKNDYRWEGVFWIWERRFMENTGGPGQKWNVRREWSRRKTDKRELYYSEVDRRIHLVGAEEGWLQVGHFSGLDTLGEVRMFDTDGNGYFDRWEYYSAALDPVPQRVVTVRDERARRIPSDYPSVSRFYNDQVLPAAIAADEQLLLAMNSVLPFDPPAELKSAMVNGPPNFRRYAMDVAREMHYQAVREHFTRRANDVLKRQKMDDLRPLNSVKRETTGNSYSAWRLLRALEQLEIAYGQGDYDKSCSLLNEITRIEETVK